MINTEILEHLVRLAIYSTAIKREKPVSVMLIAPPEHGKTEVLKKFAFISTVKIMTDFNTFVFSEYANEYQLGLKKTIIIPDFIRVIKKKYSAQANSLTIMNAITEEGWTGKLPLGQVTSKTIYANIITALTTDELRDKRHKWNKIGFLSRFIPVTYSYSKLTVRQIREYIKDRIYHTDKPYDFKVPKIEIDVTLPKELAREIENLSLDISEEENILGFRLQRQLQVLAMSNAVASQRNLVINEDIKIIEKITKFINYNFNPI